MNEGNGGQIARTTVIDVPMKGQRDLATVTAEIRAYQDAARRAVLSYCIEIGRRLVEAKDMVAHGEWGAYLREELGFSQSTANNHMRLFEAYGAEQMTLTGAAVKHQAFADLSYTQALALLALPSEEEREAFVAEHDMAALSTRELKEELRRRGNAPEELMEPADPDQPEEGNKADSLSALQAELARAHSRAVDAEAERERILRETEESRERIIDAMAERDKAKLAAANAEARAEAAGKSLEKAKAELKAARDAEAEALKKFHAAEKDRTVPKETLEKLRKEAEKAAEKSHKADYEKLDAAQKEAAKARAEAEKARKEVEEQADRLSALQTEKEKMADRLSALEKALRAAAPEVAQFRVLFEGAQEALNRCVEALPGLPPDKAPGCARAIKRLLEGSLETLEANKWEAAMPE